MQAEPRKQHQWLQQLVGEWTFEVEATTEPGQPPTKLKGSEQVRTLGDFWILAEGEGEMPTGGTGRNVFTIGFDPQKDRFVGTWVGSMMEHLWVYEGALDATEKILTLETQGPSMAGDGTTAQYRDVIEIKSADYRTLTSHMVRGDGTAQSFMVAHYRRKK